MRPFALVSSIAVLLAGAVVAQAQVINGTTYPFTTLAGVPLEDMSSGTTQLVGASLDDTASAVVNIGFEYWFNGVRTTQFSINANGLLRFGPTVVSTGFTNNLATVLDAPKVGAYWEDLCTGTNGKVHFKVVGSAPTRKLVVEWQNMQISRGAGCAGLGNGTFQIWLFETTGLIQFVYAAIQAPNPVDGGYSTGIQAGLATNFASVTTATSTVSYVTANNAQANLIAAGTSFTFTPVVPADPTGLNFTGTTSISTTLNWTDNSSNEVGFVVYRSTDGGSTYTFMTQTAANVITLTDNAVIPNTTYFYRVFAVSEGALSNPAQNSVTTAPAGNVSSTGVGGPWSAPATWAGGVVPTGGDNVTIVDGSTVTVDIAASAFSLTVGQGGSGVLLFEQTTARTLTVGGDVTVATGATLQSNPAGTVTTHNLLVGGNLVNNGTLDLSTNANTAAATLTFTGAGSVTFSGSGATTNIRALAVNKGTSSASMVELLPANFTVQGVTTNVAGWLTLTNGTLKLSGTFSGTNRVFTTATYSIAATGGFWLNNPNYSVVGQAGGTTTSNNGLLRVSQGVFNIGVGAGDGMLGGTGAVFIIEGGTVNASGRLDPQNPVTYTQTGGTVNVATVGNTVSAFGSFEIFSPAATFNMSGGTINLVNPAVAATKDDFTMRATTQNITGGLVVFGTGVAPATYAIPFGTSFLPNFVVNPTMTLNINNVAVFFRGTTAVNNGAIISTAASARFDFAGAAPMSYSGAGTFGTLAAPFAGVGISSNSTFPTTLTSPIFVNRVNLFAGGFINSNQITLGNGGASTTVVQIGSTGLTTPGGSFDVSPVHNQGTGGQILIYAFETVPRTTGVEINPTRVLTSMSLDNPNNLTIAGGNLTLSAAATALTLTNGRVITGASTLALSSGTAAVVRTAGMVDGNFQKNYAAVASKTFEVGTANGFSPVIFNATAGTFPSPVVVAAVQSTAPGIAPVNKALTRHWRLSATGLTADLTFTYLDPADIPGTVTEANLHVYRIDGLGVTDLVGVVNTAANTGAVTGVTTFSNWTLAEAGEVAATDLSITKSDGQASAVPGGSAVYSITASNAGPFASLGSTVADSFPAECASVAWTCAGAGGGTCTAGGVGNINDLVDLPTGASVTYTATCSISASATGTLANTATVATPAGLADPDAANNTASDSEPLVPTADLGVTKTDGVGSVTPGGTTTYTIVASNPGPSDAPGTTVSDTFAGVLSCTWTCVGSAGGTCTAGPVAGNINDTANLPSGGSVTYSAVCTVSPSASGTLSNTATATAAGGVTDPSGANNSATDVDTVSGGQPLRQEVEPNNTSATANALGSDHARVLGNVFPASDVDFYSFTGAAGDRVYAATMTSQSAGSSINSILDLIASDGTTIIETDNDDGSFGSTSSSIAGTTLPTSGTFFLRVRENTTGTIRPYLLYFQLRSGAPVVETEPNDAFPGQALPAGGWVSGATSAVADVDFFSLNLNAGDTVYLSLDLDPERDAVEWNGNLGLGAFGANILLVNDAGNAGPDSEAYFMTVQTAGSYSIRVAATATFGTYHMSATVFPHIDEGVNCTTYTSTNVPVAIPTGPGIVTSTLVIPGNPQIADIDVSLNLNHTFIPDLDVQLTAPTGNTVGLFSDVGNAVSAPAVMITTLDDEAAVPVSSFVIVEGPSFTPELSYRLGWFDGEPAGGTWTLTIRDDAAGDGGTLNSWSVRVCEPTPPPACGPGFVPVTVFSTNFESGADGFTHSGTADEWELGLPTFAPVTGCNSGTNCFKTDLDNTYEFSSNQDLLSPPINLAGMTGPVTVSWAQKYQIESANFDHVLVEARQVGVPLNAVRLFDWLGATMTDSVGSPTVIVQEAAGWGLYRADASALAGSNTELRFHLDSDTIVNLAGLGIDDVTVTACAAAGSNADLSITKTDGVTTATPGGSVTYTITASNAGPDPVTGATVADTFPATLTCAWTCAGAGGGSCTAAGAGNINDTVNLPVGGSVTYTASCSIASSATGSLSNTATTTVPGGVSDPVPGNNSATDTDTLAPSADLAITKDDGVTQANPGGSVTYIIAASNAGPSAAPGSTVADTFPAVLTCTWTCTGSGGGTCTASGAGNINDIANLPVGGSATYTAVCSVDVSATGSLSNTATVAAAGGITDPVPGNNSATDVDSVLSIADLSVTKTDGVTSAIPGAGVTYTIVASNAGPSPAPGTQVADTFPASLTCTWTCAGSGGGTCTASGAGNIIDSANLPAGGAATYTASCTIAASATGTLSNTVTVDRAVGIQDPDPSNNSATDTDTLDPTADLSITKDDGVTSAIPGTSVTYTIAASNPGPSDAPGTTVADAFPADLTCTWTCTGSGGGTCTGAGAGNINDIANVPSGGSVTYTASCSIASTASGTLSNTATVAAAGGITDPTPGNNSATDTDTLVPTADLSITKDDGVTSVPPGGSVTYTIVASNPGPSFTDANSVVDNFDANLTCTWTCAASGGGACNPGPVSGNINDLADLPVGASATYTANCAVSSTASGSLPNTATITPSIATDPNPSNNSATDVDVIAQILNIGDVTVTEGNSGTTAAIFVVTLDAPSASTITVDFTTVDGTATVADNDYTPLTGTLIFAPGDTSKMVTGSVIGDLNIEADETFTVSLSNSTNAVIGDGIGLGTILNDDVALTPTRDELIHDSRETRSLGLLPGTMSPTFFRIMERAHTSYEVLVDAVTGDIGSSGPALDRLASDATTVLQSSGSATGGSSRSLRFENGTASDVADQFIRVQSAGCDSNCDPSDTYRIRAYDTTYRMSRFNNSATQVTVVVVNNPTDQPVTGNLWFWSPSGALLGSLPVSLQARETFVVNTSTIGPLAGQGGSVTMSNDAPFGALTGKAVAVEPGTGFTFDTPMVPRAATTKMVPRDN